MCSGGGEAAENERMENWAIKTRTQKESRQFQRVVQMSNQFPSPDSQHTNTHKHAHIHTHRE